MEKDVLKLIEKIKVLKEKVKLFLESYYFILFLSILSVITWKLDLSVLPYTLVIIFSIVLFLVKANKKVIFSLIMFSMYCNKCSPINTKSFIFIFTLILGLLLIVIIIRDSFNKNFNFKDRLLYCMLLILGSMFISLINTPSLKDSFISISMYLICIGLYIYGYHFIKDDEESKTYIIISLMFSSFVIGIQMILNSVENVEIRNFISVFKYIATKDNHLGWGLTNHYVMIFVTSIILNIYLFMRNKCKYKKVLIIIITIIELLFFTLTLSRGAYIAFGAVILLLILSIFYYSNNKKRDFKYALIFIGITLLFLFILSFTPLLDTLIRKIKGFGTSLSGREILYDLGIAKFKKHPIIGHGVYSSKYFINKELPVGVNWVRNYHNIYIQILACQGILGLITFLIFVGYYLKLCAKKGLFNNLLFIFMCYLLIHGIVDTTLFNMKIMPILSFLMIFVRKNDQYNQTIDIFDKNDIIQLENEDKTKDSNLYIEN